MTLGEKLDRDIKRDIRNLIALDVKQSLQNFIKHKEYNGAEEVRIIGI